MFTLRDKISPMKLHELLDEWRRELQARENRDISKKQLAAEIGITRSQLARYTSESVKGDPGGEAGIKIANYFIRKFGVRGLEFYEVLGWEIPILPDDIPE